MPELSSLTRETLALLDNYKNLGLMFPQGYNVKNELSRALLKLVGQKTKHGPVLQVCTKESVVNALLDMCIQGLTVNQGYFIPYDNVLTFQRSYFGTVALMKRLTGAKNIVAQCVYKGDEFEYEIENGISRVTKHKSGLQNMVKENVIAAYAIISFEDGRQYAEIMPRSQILAAWRMSRACPFGQDGKLRRDSTHYLYFEEMAKRTVIQRACKIMLNSAVTDPSGALIVQKLNEEIEEASEMALELETTEAIENMEVLELPEETPSETGEAPEVETEPEPALAERPF